MIVDKLTNAKRYNGLGFRIEQAFKYIKNTDLLQIKEGKYEIDGNKIFAIVSEYKTKDLAEG